MVLLIYFLSTIVIQNNSKCQIPIVYEPNATE